VHCKALEGEATTVVSGSEFDAACVSGSGFDAACVSGSGFDAACVSGSVFDAACAVHIALGEDSRRVND